MPPRYAYWTILIDDKPTAFRAREQEELLPTLHQLRRTNKDVVLKWFARGRLWETPAAAQAASHAPAPAREKRGHDWRPGGAHKDPRDRFKKGAKNRDKGPGGHERPWSAAPPGVPDHARPRRNAPPGSQPWREKPRGAAPAASPPWREKPRSAPSGSKPWRDKPRGAPSGSEPWRDNPRGAAPRGPQPWRDTSHGAPSGDSRPWRDNQAAPPPRGGRPWRDRPNTTTAAAPARPLPPRFPDRPQEREETDAKKRRESSSPPPSSAERRATRPGSRNRR